MEKNEIGLAVGDQLLRLKNGRVSLVTVHRVTRKRAYVNVPNCLGTGVYEESICYWSKDKYSTYPASDMTGAFYEIATPEKIAQHDPAARRAEVKKIKHKHNESNIH